MKIVHVSLLSYYTDNLSYQDNLLPKYHVKLGHDVTLITSRFCYNEKGKKQLANKTNYVNSDNVKIIRLNSTSDKNNDLSKLVRFYGLYESISLEKPDILFVHGCNYLDIKVIVKYLKKHRNVKVYLDNHCDYTNSGRNFISKNILHKIIWKHMAQLIEPYTTKFYGVLPARVEWLKDVYKLPSKKCELLIMGADDELIDEVKSNGSYNEIKKQYNISKDDFVIVTGGKIDLNKIEVLSLMECIKDFDNVKLLVFGSVIPELQDRFNRLVDNNKVIYVGWVDNKKSLELFNVSDLIVFPGKHSVYWEQAVAMKKPVICRYLQGTQHVDIGGNVRYLYDSSKEEIEKIIKDIIYNKDIHKNMLMRAEDVAASKFLYSEIAKKSIE